MSQNRKTCIYKNCDKERGLTLFRFPTDKERFLIWVENSGLELNGDIDMSEPRYLCEKHFSLNYISNQSRRKMLVHTAIPEKYNETELDTSEPIKFNIINIPSEKKQRKNQHSPREQTTIAINSSPPKILNNNKKKILQEAYEAAAEEEFIEEYTTELQQQQSSESSNNLILDDLGPTTAKKPHRTYKCIVVKSKNIKSPKTIMNYIKPAAVNDELKDEETFFVTEEGNISSSDSKIEKKKTQAASISSTQMSSTPSTAQQHTIENYSEFIFNGEIYVQMPKRIFEEEKEKLRAETLKYKNMLLKLKNQIDDCIEN